MRISIRPASARDPQPRQVLDASHLRQHAAVKLQPALQRLELVPEHEPFVDPVQRSRGYSLFLGST
jgi:hypothetical protein